MSAADVLSKPIRTPWFVWHLGTCSQPSLNTASWLEQNQSSCSRLQHSLLRPASIHTWDCQSRVVAVWLWLLAHVSMSICSINIHSISIPVSTSCTLATGPFLSYSTLYNHCGGSSWLSINALFLQSQWCCSWYFCLICFTPLFCFLYVVFNYLHSDYFTCWVLFIFYSVYDWPSPSVCLFLCVIPSFPRCTIK